MLVSSNNSEFKCLFANGDNEKNLTWHVEGWKGDGLLRHPADSKNESQQLLLS